MQVDDDSVSDVLGALNLSEEQFIRLDSMSEEELDREIGAVLASAGAALLQRLRQEMSAGLAANREYRVGFEVRLRAHWKPALDLYELIMVTTQEAGQVFNATYRPQAAVNNDAKFEALSRLHARACLTASEILSLLTSGHADGAHSRWRTLHEIAVVAFLLSEHDTTLAERYLLHDAIQAAKGAELYTKYQDRLSEYPITQAELEEHRARRASLIAMYGKGFESDYGWAAGALNIREPKFDQIERVVGLDHIRPYYRLASISVHPNARGLNFSLAADQSRMLLAGPSNGGLADPGHHTLLSLLQCTICLMNLRPGIEQATLLPALQQLTNEAGDAFLAAHREWKREMQKRVVEEINSSEQLPSEQEQEVRRGHG